MKKQLFPPYFTSNAPHMWIIKYKNINLFRSVGTKSVFEMAFSSKNLNHAYFVTPGFTFSTKNYLPFVKPGFHQRLAHKHKHNHKDMRTRRMAYLTQFSIPALLNPMINKIADTSSAILLLICSHEVWIKVVYDWATALCLSLCLCRPRFHQSKANVDKGIERNQFFDSTTSVNTQAILNFWKQSRGMFQSEDSSSFNLQDAVNLR